MPLRNRAVARRVRDSILVGALGSAVILAELSSRLFRPLAKRHQFGGRLSSVWNRRASVAVVRVRVARRFGGGHEESLSRSDRTSLLWRTRCCCKPRESRAIEARTGIHAARVDMPSVIDMSHASPDRWGTLPPPVDLFERLRAPAPPLDEYDIPESMFGTISVAAN